MKKEYISPDIELSVIETTATFATSGSKDQDANNPDEEDDGGELGAKPNFDIWENDELSEKGFWS